MSRRKYFFSQKPSRGRQRGEMRRSFMSFEALAASGGFSPAGRVFVIFY
jgi:hypothetical protein